MANTIPFNLMGLQVSGDLGGITIYTDRFGKKVAFPKEPPKTIASKEQASLRKRFADAQKDYMILTVQQKKDYEDLARKTNIPMTGQNLWISVSMKGNISGLETLEDQSGISVVHPTLHQF